MAGIISCIKFISGSIISLKFIAVCALIIIALDTSEAASKIREVREFEFRGLKNLSRYELMRDSGLSVKGKKIIVDMLLFEEKLSSIGIIDSFNINIRDGRLIVSVIEKEPFASFALVNNGRTVLFEVGRDFSMISKNGKYSHENPLVVIGREDLPDGKLSERVKRLCSLLDLIREKHKTIFYELREVCVCKNGIIKIILKNRITEFFMTSSEINFKRLKYVAGYLDRKRHYPGRLHITGNRIAIR